MSVYEVYEWPCLLCLLPRPVVPHICGWCADLPLVLVAVAEAAAVSSGLVLKCSWRAGGGIACKQLSYGTCR